MSSHIIPDVYLSLNGSVIPSHGYVVISDISIGADTALLCHTNRPPPNGERTSGGDWFGPDGSVVGESFPGIRRSRDPMVVRLYRATSESPRPEGMYHCEIQDDMDTLQTVYVGLYHEGQGNV